MASADLKRPGPDEALSPRQNASSVEQAIRNVGSMDNSLNSLAMRADPDAQAAVTDYLDFTEYLPSDMMRSLTLVGKLDETYVNASASVHDLTTVWGQLPSIPPAERHGLGPVELRAQISENLQQAISSRVYAHAEAVRMAENINRHYNRAKTILAKLETMRDNYPADDHKSPVAASKSPQLARPQKITLRLDGHKVRRPRVPRITVPGEVLAPYELNYDAFSSESESSSEEESNDDDDSAIPNRLTPAPQGRIKVMKAIAKPPKSNRAPKFRPSVPPSNYIGVSTSAALAQLAPPPENAVIGSSDAPWGQLTPFELARLRKRMKKNAAWTPSDTMVARELNDLGRGVDHFKAAKQKAEEEGKPFDGQMPAPIVDPDTGEERMPLGALTMEALASDDKNFSNRGMKLNEAKKLKRELLAKMAAEEAEESARRFDAIARTLMSDAPQPMAQEQPSKAANKPRPPKKRKRDSVAEADAEKPELPEGQAQRPQFKRTKTETPVPPPQLSNPGQMAQETPVQVPQRAPGPAAVLHSTTPIPLPVHGQDQSITAKSGASVVSAASPTPSHNAGPSSTSAALAPVKLAPTETPIPPPIHSPKKSTTPILPPVRETRKTQAARMHENQKELQKETLAPLTLKSPSRATSPAPLTPKPDPDTQPTAPPAALLTPAPGASTNGAASTATAVAVVTTTRRPGSRGKAGSQEPQPSLAADRPRRTSTARNTPAPERLEQPITTTTTTRPSSRRAERAMPERGPKRPAPGVISRTNSGGNSAVGTRKAAPKKKRGRPALGAGGSNSKDKGGAGGAADAAGGGDVFEVEVDDEGNVIDPDEPRYCLCNRVSFGTMVQCDNVDNCKQEWFHLECVSLAEIPARTTKWYCPDCRILLNIGEKGEVSARGVKA
ncbi:hypothetical protein B0T26DRAFT_640980 [Lasiosphaeria miniovina]|uniref:PHD-type domain-containing protein n=1 Tax=Lasiosphaeria miniovina TaxID=1954250 RepID=A0AA40AVT2_9PEZI|nr:uncharacterized protein B0T26DRAFT_640980 [Lasiosphaeria miniovina]KAK0722938.1 hypothetical protein B0T26DRAFT_640980 [Lasiosphaeria miniovina]